MDARLRLVYEFLDSDLYENALFITERLHALEPENSSWTHLMSLCCLRLGRVALALEHSREKGIRGLHLGCSYVFAQACLRQKNYVDGITALQQAQPLCCDDQGASARFIPDFAAVNRLLGKLYRASGDAKSAVDCHVLALEANPFMWDAFTDLCDSGVQLRVSNVFKLQSSSSSKPDHQKLSKVAPSDVNAAHSLRGNSLRAGPPNDVGLREAAPQPFYISRNDAPIGDENIDTTETRNLRTVSGDATMGYQGMRRSARLQDRTTPSNGLTDRSSADPTMTRDAFKRLSKPRNPVRPTERKTSAIGRGLNPGARASVTTNGRDPKAAAPTSPTPAGRSGHPTKLASVAAAAAQLDQEKLQALMNLLHKLGSAYYHLSQFQPQVCIEALSSLPAEQQATPWVLSKIARAQYEMMSYKEAKATFQLLRRLAPSWLEDLEVYSTVLWHLKDDVELAFLGHELTDDHHLAPQTWCAMGNSFSLQRCHQEAIKCFRRAGQLQPQLAYSYSLLGHEHFEAEEYAEATAAFRKALQVDPRHYSAWVGLGRAQERLGQGDRALQYYRSGEKVNPNNAALLTYIARMLEKMGKHRLALNYLRRGIDLEPSENLASLIRLQTARLFLRLAQPAEALRDLHLVQQMAPDEPSVHFLMGQAFAMSGPSKRGEALKAYTNALSLDPSNETIRDAVAMLGGAH
ncbi:related to Protein bimA [Cephalotrichum gorgonifer]|uniref:Related to Protein bimA n=1 Tax=Cephalotrichum gorgonifer TaxID=2041049 RepID=A0AAE8N1Y3_9PEZI|nr:related to Protein bimA [Cephalotrichum gorgonifer]